MGSVTILMGLMAAFVGLVVASRLLRVAHRTSRRIAARSSLTLESWGAWFLGGFSGVSMGIRWISAVAAVLAWALAGIVLIGLGIRLV